MTAEEIKVDPSRIRLMRKQQRWTQDEMSRAAGLSLRTIQRAEDSGRVSLATLKSLAAVLEVEAGELEAAGHVASPLLPDKAWVTYVAGALAITIAAFWVTGITDRIDLVAPAPTKEIVVVLPFILFADDGRSSDLVDVLTHDLIVSLRKSGRANVVPERDSKTVSRNGGTVEQIGDALSASLVIEGSVRSMSDRVRITMQVIDVGSAAHLWSETYDRNTDEIELVIPEISHSVEAVYRN